MNAEQEEISRGLLARLVARFIGGDESRFEFRRSRSGRFNTTYFVKGAARPVLLRIAPPPEYSPKMLFYERRMMRQEPPLHELVRSLTSVPVPEIIGFDWSHRRIERDYLVMERMPGIALSELRQISHGCYERVMFEIGRYLRQLHSIEGESYGYVGPHRPMKPQKDWAAAFRVMWNKLLDDIRSVNGYSEREEVLMRQLLDRHFSIFLRDAPARLLHMDIWSQNILVDSDCKITGIVDMDRALWGDVEIEFAVLDYTGCSEQAFWQGYGSERDLSEAAQVRRIFYLLYEIQKYIFIRRARYGRPELADRYRVKSLRLARQLM